MSTTKKKKQGLGLFGIILSKINWFKLIFVLIIVGSASYAYLTYEKQIHWFLVQRPEEKRIQMQYHLYGRHPIPDPTKGVVFVSTGVFDRTQNNITQFIEKARAQKNLPRKNKSAPPNLLYFSGPSGIGKSSSLVRIANQYLKKRGWYVYYYDFSKLFQNFKLSDCLNVINAATTNHRDSQSMRSKAMYNNMPQQIQKKKFAKYLESLQVLLQNDKQVLIIFDGFHIFDEKPEIKILMEQFMKLVRKGAYMIGAGLNTQVLDYLSTQVKMARRKLWQVQQHEKLTEKQIRRYTKGNYPNLRKPDIQRLVDLSDTFIEIRSLVKLNQKQIQKMKKAKTNQIKKIISASPSALQDICELCMNGKISQGKSTRILLRNNIAQDLQSWQTRYTRMIFEDNFIDLCPWKPGQRIKCYDHRDFEVQQIGLAFQDIDITGVSKLVREVNIPDLITNQQEEQDDPQLQNSDNSQDQAKQSWWGLIQSSYKKEDNQNKLQKSQKQQIIQNEPVRQAKIKDQNENQKQNYDNQQQKDQNNNDEPKPKSKLESKPSITPNKNKNASKKKEIVKSPSPKIQQIKRKIIINQGAEKKSPPPGKMKKIDLQKMKAKKRLIKKIKIDKINDENDQAKKQKTVKTKIEKEKPKKSVKKVQKIIVKQVNQINNIQKQQTIQQKVNKQMFQQNQPQLSQPQHQQQHMQNNQEQQQTNLKQEKQQENGVLSQKTEQETNENQEQPQETQNKEQQKQLEQLAKLQFEKKQQQEQQQKRKEQQIQRIKQEQQQRRQKQEQQQKKLKQEQQQKKLKQEQQQKKIEIELEQMRKAEQEQKQRIRIEEQQKERKIQEQQRIKQQQRKRLQIQQKQRLERQRIEQQQNELKRQREQQLKKQQQQQEQKQSVKNQTRSQ